MINCKCICVWLFVTLDSYLDSARILYVVFDTSLALYHAYMCNMCLVSWKEKKVALGKNMR